MGGRAQSVTSRDCTGKAQVDGADIAATNCNRDPVRMYQEIQAPHAELSVALELYSFIHKQDLLTSGYR